MLMMLLNRIKFDRPIDSSVQLNYKMNYTYWYSYSAILMGMLTFQVDTSTHTPGNNYISGELVVNHRNRWWRDSYYKGIITSFDPRGAPLPISGSFKVGRASFTMRVLEYRPPIRGYRFEETTIYTFIDNYLMGHFVLSTRNDVNYHLFDAHPFNKYAH
jgi:hypothetical protein